MMSRFHPNPKPNKGCTCVGTFVHANRKSVQIHFHFSCMYFPYMTIVPTLFGGGRWWYIHIMAPSELLQNTYIRNYKSLRRVWSLPPIPEPPPPFFPVFWRYEYPAPNRHTRGMVRGEALKACLIISKDYVLSVCLSVCLSVRVAVL